jgi:hypothetical protein
MSNTLENVHACLCCIWPLGIGDSSTDNNDALAWTLFWMPVAAMEEAMNQERRFRGAHKGW